jgi:hypothetical protein
MERNTVLVYARSQTVLHVRQPDFIGYGSKISIKELEALKIPIQNNVVVVGRGHFYKSVGSLV